MTEGRLPSAMEPINDLPTELPARLRRVAELAAEGFADKEIAVRMEISVHTVDSHWRKLRERYDAVSRTQVLSAYTEEKVRLRLRALAAERERLAKEVHDLRRQRADARALQRELLESLTRTQNEILTSLGSLMRKEDEWTQGITVFRSRSAFLGAAPRARTLDLRGLVAAGTCEVLPEGFTHGGVRFEGDGERAYRLSVMDWPHLSGWAGGPVLHGDLLERRSEDEPVLRIVPLANAGFVGFAFASVTRQGAASDVWRFTVETSRGAFDLDGACGPDAPGFLGVQAYAPIVAIGARCGGVCCPQIADVAYAEPEGSSSPAGTSPRRPRGGEA